MSCELLSEFKKKKMSSYIPTKFDKFLYWIKIFLSNNKAIVYATALSFLGGMFVNTLSTPELSKDILSVMKNVFAINERPLNIVSWIASLSILLPSFLTWVTNYHYKKRGIEKLFEGLLKERISPSIQSFSKGTIAWDTSMTLQQVPDLTKGWTLDEIDFDYEKTNFSIPQRWKAGYKEYYKNNYDRKGFKDDGNKYMLTINPSSFTDAPSLKLNLINCKYSEVQFYRDFVATITQEKNEIIEEIIKKNRIYNPHSLCLHLVVITSDKKILLTKRSDKVSYYPSTWSASIEEQFHDDDFKVENTSPLENCVDRLFMEEIGVLNSKYNIKNLRILSVFLESDTLNVSLAGLIKLNIDSTELELAINNTPRMDYEFKEFCFLTFDEVFQEIKYPTKKMHPSGGYRLLLSLYHKYGPLKMINNLMK